MSVALAFRNRSVSKEVPKAAADAFAQFETSVGGRAALIAVLSMAEMTPEIEAVLCAVGDPKHDTIPLADICAAHALQPGHVVMAYHRAQMQQVQILALSAVAARVPEVVAEIVRMALPRTEECETCHGKGTVPAPRRKTRGRKPSPLACPACGGKGKMHHAGQGSQQDRVLDLARLVSKGGGVNVAVQANTTVTPQAGGGGTSSPLGQLQQAIQATLSSKVASPSRSDGRTSDPHTIDATVIPESVHAPRLDD